MGICAVLSTLQSGDEEVESALVPFLQAYVAKLRAGQKRGSPASQVRAASHALRANLLWMAIWAAVWILARASAYQKDYTPALSCWSPPLTKCAGAVRIQTRSNVT